MGLAWEMGFGVAASPGFSLGVAASPPFSSQMGFGLAGQRNPCLPGLAGQLISAGFGQGSSSQARMAGQLISAPLGQG